MYHYKQKEVNETLKDNKFVITSILLDDSKNNTNIQLEQFIREFEEVSWQKKNECDRRHNISIPIYNRTYVRPTTQEMKEIWGIDENDKPHKSDFDVHKLITTGWYYAYQGGVTESSSYNGKVHWYVLDVPLQVSTDQISCIKHILLSHLNNNCTLKTAAHNKLVSRPVGANKNNNV